MHGLALVVARDYYGVEVSADRNESPRELLDKLRSQRGVRFPQDHFVEVGHPTAESFDSRPDELIAAENQWLWFALLDRADVSTDPTVRVFEGDVGSDEVEIYTIPLSQLTASILVPYISPGLMAVEFDAGSVDSLEALAETVEADIAMPPMQSESFRSPPILVAHDWYGRPYGSTLAVVCANPSQMGGRFRSCGRRWREPVPEPDRPLGVSWKGFFDLETGEPAEPPPVEWHYF